MINENDDKNITQLEEKIRAAREQGVGLEKKKKNSHFSYTPSDEQEAENMNMGFRAGTELVVAMIAGGLIGFGIDSVLPTKPFFFIFFIIVGICTGFWNIYKITNNLGTSVGVAPLHKVKKQGKETQQKKLEDN